MVDIVLVRIRFPYLRTVCPCAGIVKSRRGRTCRVARAPFRNAYFSDTSGLSDVLPAGVGLRAEFSVNGGGESVWTWAEVVGDSTERDQETLHVLR
jgi:hypothetical protein